MHCTQSRPFDDVTELKDVSQRKEAEISDLKVKVDELKVTACREASAREEMRLHYQQRLNEKQAELEHYRRLDAIVGFSRALTLTSTQPTPVWIHLATLCGSLLTIPLKFVLGLG